jgi:hypothetical protein
MINIQVTSIESVLDASGNMRLVTVVKTISLPLITI